jgi:D-alanine-D-alanine ligase
MIPATKPRRRKRLRIALLYNEPIVGTAEGRKVLEAKGITTPVAKGAMADKPGPVDLSEVGVVEEMDDLRRALNSLGYRTTVFNVDSNIQRMLDYLRKDRPDLVFNIVECVENESIQEMNVAGVYELLKIPFTGAGPLALGTALNKPRVKEILTYHGILTPRFRVCPPGEPVRLFPEMKFPVIVKPSHEDGSVGISDASVVFTLTDLRERVRYIHREFDQSALVEEYIDGRELNAAIIGNTPPVVLPISEIDFSGLTEGMHRIVSYEAKWMNGTVAFEGTKGVCPARLTKRQAAAVRDIALHCYRLFGLRDYARVDFRLTKDGALYVLEVNPNPDISRTAGFARSAKAHGWGFPEVIGKIVESALGRTG